MSLQKLIEDLKDRANNAHAKQVDIYIEPDELLKLCEAAEVMRLGLYGEHECNYLAHGICNKCGVCVPTVTLSKADSICGGENGKG